MNIKKDTVNSNWKLFTLTNDKGMEVQFLNYGGIITKILAPDKNGNIENVVLSYSNYKDYETDPNFFGAIIGPVAGRIENAEFTINKEKFNLEKNAGRHHLHGGSNALHRVIWEAETFKSENKVGVTLSYLRKNEENGYPGNLTLFVSYTLTNSNQLVIDYNAVADKSTPVTLTNHSYFNLTGDVNNTILTHHMQTSSTKFLELNRELVATGKLIDVTHSLFDFRKGRKLKDGIMAKSIQNRIAGNGYDHYFIFNHDKQESVIVKEETSGRVLKIETNQPGMVLYTGQNILEGLDLSGGTSKKYIGVCFETQSPPASLRHEELPTTILEANDIYKKQTIFSFSIEK